MRPILLNTFYDHLTNLIEINGGYKTLNEELPQHMGNYGVYFFFDNEIFRDNNQQLKVIRVGTHATRQNSQATLRQRLKQHKGNIGNGGGNHRGSVFRKHVGIALIENDNLIDFPHWGVGNNANREIRENEYFHEVQVSNYVRNLNYIFLHVNDFELRSYIEKCSIELLSNNNQEIQIDIPNANWLGFSLHNNIAVAHIWNIHYVGDYQQNDNQRYVDFLNCIEVLIGQH